VRASQAIFAQVTTSLGKQLILRNGQQWRLGDKAVTMSLMLKMGENLDKGEEDCWEYQ
jgi:hypothetical protein